MLILDADAANHVRGLTIAGHALAPMPLADGTFALPEAVLNDPAHQVHWDYLIANASITADSGIRRGEPSIPDVHGSPIINSDWELDPAKITPYRYNSSWKVGQIIVVPPA